MSPKLHAAAGTLGMGLIALFWTSTVWVELFGTPQGIATVKTNIVQGLWLLVPALAAAGIGGAQSARNRRGPIIQAKTRRMRIAGLNGLLILVPSALFLAGKAQMADFDGAFYAVQTVELLAGAVNMRLLWLNLRDGRAMARARVAQR
ncbi:hypothetical protein [Rhodovulum adriaticum]|uniref:Transmembrane protein n=1 Tax=Rhodovulum adriaticum TaxID=35804 RepID=A0A4R2NLP7_RHOAD|nr:hypothetical protein [Rhodovulum adriaticum]MBK1635750.1 hypothetical protein [Rhodovulum adriaticum]TCP22487.1 hypothetical protein EV656_10673 [Rhodovulum adriaticum]